MKAAYFKAGLSRPPPSVLTQVCTLPNTSQRLEPAFYEVLTHQMAPIPGRLFSPWQFLSTHRGQAAVYPQNRCPMVLLQQLQSVSVTARVTQWPLVARRIYRQALQILNVGFLFLSKTI